MRERPRVAELLVANYPEWLAGIMEVACYMGFHIRTQHKKTTDYTYASPVINMGDNDLQRLQRLVLQAGGNIVSRWFQASHTWCVVGQDAVALAELVQRYVPSRWQLVEAFKLWEASGSTAERIEIATRFNNDKAQGRSRAEVNVSQYSELVRNPLFLAGMVDARGGIHFVKPHWPQIEIGSTNESLLQSLQISYGGRFDRNRQTGQTRLRFKKDETIRLYRIVRDHLKMRDLSALERDL